MKIHTSYNPARGQSGALWSDFPFNRIAFDQSEGHFCNLMDDADTIVDAHNRQLTQVGSSSFAHARNPTASTSLTDLDNYPGVILIESGGHASQGNGINVQSFTGTLVPSAYPGLYWEARFKVLTATDQHYIGLNGHDTAVIASGALDETTGSHAISRLGFYHDNNSGAKWEFQARCYGGSFVNITDIPVADDAWTKLGFKVRKVGDKHWLTLYVNGEQFRGERDITNCVPTAIVYPTFVSQCAGTSTDAEMALDWMYIGQVFR